jgi:hypothetical protein
MRLREKIDMACEDMLVLEPREDFDSAIIGVVETFGSRRALYDRSKVISILSAQGMGNEGAEEFFDFNIIGAHMGDTNPCFYTSLEDLC